METAKEQAVQAKLAIILLDQAESWREVSALRAYCTALEERLVSATGLDDRAIASARQWLSWAQSYAEAIDPLKTLPSMPDVPVPEAEELKSYLKGWSPYGPEAHKYGWR